METLTIRPHNNQESTMQVVTGQLHFRSQTHWVLTQLLSGRTVSGKSARAEYGIEDVRARMHELKRMNVLFSFRPIPGTHGSREWFMNEEQIFQNKLFL